MTINGCDLGMGVLRSFGAAADELLDALFDFAPGEEDAPAAGGANQADVGAETHDAPLVAAAGVGLAQAKDVVEAQVEHAGIITAANTQLTTRANPLPAPVLKVDGAPLRVCARAGLTG